METQRFYAACLASYNNGILHGEWIDTSEDIDDMQAAVSAMLRRSPCPNVTVTDPDTGQQVPSAEEWAIHDHEGLGDIGEYAGLETIASRVALASEAESMGIPFDIALQAQADIGDEWAESFYREIDEFTHSPWAQFAQELTEEKNDMKEIPEWARNYIDWDSMGHDWRLSGEFSAYESSDFKTYFFSKVYRA